MMSIKKTTIVTFSAALIAFAGLASAQTKKKVAVKKKAQAPVVQAAPVPPFATAAEIEEGKNLILKSDCLACHKMEEKLVGPPYVAIAAKYLQDQNTLNTLTQKIISGGTGVWGAVPMAPHPAITPADANKMIKYILTLNSKSTLTSSK
jgi:cytochrome c